MLLVRSRASPRTIGEVASFGRLLELDLWILLLGALDAGRMDQEYITNNRVVHACQKASKKFHQPRYYLFGVNVDPVNYVTKEIGAH